MREIGGPNDVMTEERV